MSVDLLTEVEYASWPDEALVMEVQAGNIRPFSLLVQRYQTRLVWFVRRIVSDEEQATDIVQDALFKLYRSIDRYDPRRRFSTYVFTIAKNEAISWLRRQRQNLQLDEIAEIADDVELVAQFEDRERSNRVRTAIAGLEGKYRQVIELYYIDQLDYQEISSRLALPLNTVRTHLRRAKEQLATLLYDQSAT